MREDLEATQFPLTAGVCFSSRYIDPHPPLVVSCRGKQDSFSFSLSRRMSHSLPAHTQPRTCDGRASASASVRARLGDLEFSMRSTHGGRHGRKIYFFSLFSRPAVRFGNVSIFYVPINKQIFRAPQRGC